MTVTRSDGRVFLVSVVPILGGKFAVLVYASLDDTLAAWPQLQDRIGATTAQVVTGSVVGCALAGLVLVIYVLFLARRVSEPLQLMVAASQAVIAQSARDTREYAPIAERLAHASLEFAWSRSLLLRFRRVVEKLRAAEDLKLTRAKYDLNSLYQRRDLFPYPEPSRPYLPYAVPVGEAPYRVVQDGEVGLEEMSSQESKGGPAVRVSGPEVMQLNPLLNMLACPFPLPPQNSYAPHAPSAPSAPSAPAAYSTVVIVPLDGTKAGESDVAPVVLEPAAVEDTESSHTGGVCGWRRVGLRTQLAVVVPLLLVTGLSLTIGVTLWAFLQPQANAWMPETLTVLVDTEESAVRSITNIKALFVETFFYQAAIHQVCILYRLHIFV